MKILITGFENPISKFLFNKFSSEDSYEVYFLKTSNLIIENNYDIHEMVSYIKPNLIIHSMEISNVNYCELNKDNAYIINTISSKNIALICSKEDIPILYISTNYVFSGLKETSYLENDSPDPFTIYGKTKQAAESLIMTICNKYYIIRTSLIFGYEGGFGYDILKNRNDSALFCSYEKLNATFAEDLYIAIKEIICSDCFGIYNCVNSGELSKEIFLLDLCKLICLDKLIISIPLTSYYLDSNKQSNLTLDNFKIKEHFNIELPHWYNRLQQYIKFINKD